jgi:hypothetical protein
VGRNHHYRGGSAHRHLRQCQDASSTTLSRPWRHRAPSPLIFAIWAFAGFGQPSMAEPTPAAADGSLLPEAQ